MLKRSPGPSKPSDLKAKSPSPIHPVQSKKAPAKGATASKKADEPADDGECTCGAEVGKKLEALEVAVGGVQKDKAEKDYRKE